MEGIKHGAIHEGGELTRADAELVAHGREAQHDVQVLAHFVNEKVPQVLHGVQDACACVSVSTCVCVTVYVHAYECKSSPFPQAHSQTDTHTHTHTRTHKHTHTHTHTHTRTHTPEDLHSLRTAFEKASLSSGVNKSAM